MAHQFRAFATLGENPSSVPTIHVWCFTTAFNSTSSGSDLFWAPWAPSYMCVHKQTYFFNGPSFLNGVCVLKNQFFKYLTFLEAEAVCLWRKLDKLFYVQVILYA